MPSPDNRLTEGVVRPPRGGARKPAAADGAAAAEVLRLAEEVKAVYVQERCRHETVAAGAPVVYRPPARFDGSAALLGEGGVVLEKARPSAWLRLARFCLQRRLDPALFVRVGFERLATQAWQGPANLMTAEAVRHYHAALAERAGDLALALALQRETARAEISYLTAVDGLADEAAYVAVLCSETLELSPLFRLCLARRLAAARPAAAARFEAVAAVFVDAAALQLECFGNYYQEAWGDFIPADFPAQAAARCHQLYDGD